MNARCPNTPKNSGPCNLPRRFELLVRDYSVAIKCDEAMSRLAEAGEELADVLICALAMANKLGLDLSATIQKKMAKNKQRFPVGD